MSSHAAKRGCKDQVLPAGVSRRLSCAIGLPDTFRSDEPFNFQAKILLLKYAGFDNWFSNPNSLFYTFYVTPGDATFVSFLVIFAGVVIGLAGSIVGLRRFLRV